MWLKSLNNQTQEESGGFRLKWKIENKFPDLILMSNSLSGEIRTPRFGGAYDEEFFQADRRTTFQWNLTKDMDMSQNRLNVQLEVDLGKGEDWDEVVEYRDGAPKFVHYPTRRALKRLKQPVLKMEVILLLLHQHQRRSK